MLLKALHPQPCPSSSCMTDFSYEKPTWLVRLHASFSCKSPMAICVCLWYCSSLSSVFLAEVWMSFKDVRWAVKHWFDLKQTLRLNPKNWWVSGLTDQLASRYTLYWREGGTPEGMDQVTLRAGVISELCIYNCGEKKQILIGFLY